MRISDQGLAFLAAHEGFVARGYLDPAGVVTIGYGFTMRSRVFAGWWRKKHGRALRVGDPLSRTDANTLLLTMIDAEYGPPVLEKCPHLSQSQFDACVSVVYNCGARALSWRWARALRKGDAAEAGRILASTATTAGGRKLPGLVRRRADEARLLAEGVYQFHGAALGPPAIEIRAAQKALAALGFDPGPVDGVLGPKTRAALRRFQAATPGLAVTGALDPATQARLLRPDRRTRPVAVAAGASLTALLLAATSALESRAAIVLAALVCLAGLALALLLWRRPAR